ncbi:exosortase-associated protein EpsI, B-type [Roseateles sp. GG27B]
MQNDTVRSAVLAIVMAAACALAVAITPRVFLADTQSREKLAQIVPTAFGDWSVDTSILPIPPSPDLQKVLDATYDETLAMTFKNAAGERVMLSLAYGRNQHKGMITHRPEICYPAQGFKLNSSVDDGVVVFHGKPLPVKRVVATMGPRNEPITYWVMVGNEITEFGYPHRWVAIQYGLKGLIPDGVLVRVSSISADNAAAFKLQDGFIQELLAAVPPAKRHRLLGAGYP